MAASSFPVGGTTTPGGKVAIAATRIEFASFTSTSEHKSRRISFDKESFLGLKSLGFKSSDTQILPRQ